MKKLKVFISSFAIIAFVGTLLAFKANSDFASGSVYCNEGCIAFFRVGYIIDPNGSVTEPCGESGGIPIPSYVFTSNSTCVQTGAGTTFRMVDASK